MMIRPPTRAHWSQTGLAALAAFVLLTGAGCPDKHIGRLCDIPLDGGADSLPPTNFAINSLALECPSRICIKPVQQMSTTTAALCTDECSSDDDCADAEQRVKTDDTDHRCSSAGFACRTAIPNLSNAGAYACKRLCVCRDFLTGNTDVKPPSCQ
jgi:hypothetical protein